MKRQKLLVQSAFFWCYIIPSEYLSFRNDIPDIHNRKSQLARDLCLVDFETLDLYSLQEHYISHYIRNYYVQIDENDDEELEVMGFYAPELEDGEKPRHCKGIRKQV